MDSEHGGPYGLPCSLVIVCALSFGQGYTLPSLMPHSVYKVTGCGNFLNALSSLQLQLRPTAEWHCKDEEFYETGSCCVAQADLKLVILLPQLPKCCDYRCVPPHQKVRWKKFWLEGHLPKAIYP